VRALSVVVVCCVLVGIAGCGGSGSSSSSTAQTSAAQAGTSQNASTQGTTPAAASPTKTARPATTQGAASSGAAAAGSGGGTASALTRYYGSIATFGREASGSDRAAVLTALHSYLSAIAAGDWAEACGQLSTPIKRQLQVLLARAKGASARGCAAALGALLGSTPGPLRRTQRQLNVFAVRTEGDRAFVLYRSAQLAHAMISMFREEGRWRAGVLAGSNAG
jgi:hypothetical protein